MYEKLRDGVTPEKALEGLKERCLLMFEAWMEVEKWLSAALDDPKVCDEMKQDIRKAMNIFHVSCDIGFPFQKE